jgi:tetratricopeptide (TPR) repeat protein
MTGRGDTPSNSGSRPTGDPIAALIGRARGLIAAGRTADARKLLAGAVQQNGRDVRLLEILAEFELEMQRPAEAAQWLARAIDVDPTRSEAYVRLAEVLDAMGRKSEVLSLYTRLCTVQPSLAFAHFNRAVYLRKADRLEDAIAAYRRAIALGVDGAAEAWSNIGVIQGALERHDEARSAFAEALVIDARFVPALYNLGLLHEEFGEPDAALSCFERVLEVDPEYHDALARIAGARRVTDAGDPLVGRLRTALDRPSLAAPARETLSFALGKVLDDCGRYDEAFAVYGEANASARARTPRYDRAAVERYHASIRDAFDRAWLDRVAAVSTRQLVFVCGMFRSGTTLLEQMLAAHPDVTAGGEIAYFNRRLDDRFAGFPAATAGADAAALKSLGQGYLDDLDRRFPGARLVINKRPDTFRFIGLLHGLFPEARFVVLDRHPLDNCLSIYFQQLAESLAYATDLEDIVHYLLEYRGLVRHWQQLLPDRIAEVSYEALVREPRAVLERLCDFLGLEWQDDMQRPDAGTNRVRTASVWQVREPVNDRSVGRWRHYAAHLDGVVRMLGRELAPDER